MLQRDTLLLNDVMSQPASGDHVLLKACQAARSVAQTCEAHPVSGVRYDTTSASGLTYLHCKGNADTQSSASSSGACFNWLCCL